MTIKLTINPDATATIVRTDAPNPDGSPAIARWDLSGRQLAKHLRGIANAAHPFNSLSPGDKSAALDAAAQAVATTDPDLP